MKTIIAGSRDLPGDEEFIWYVADAITRSGWKKDITEVVSGGARGIDLAGEMYAKEAGYLVKRFPADWATHGKAAGLLRNSGMAKYADALIAIWDGRSRGTAHMIKEMEKQGKRIFTYIVT